MAETIIDRLRASLEKDSNLPSLPEHIRKILQLVEHEDVTFSALAREVEKDPAISLRVFRLANSALYGQTREVSSLERAFSVIGISEVPSMLAGMASVDSCERFLQDKRFNWKEFWGHCSGTAFIAGSLARRLELTDAGPEFLGGLLHDIGYLALAKFNREWFGEAVQEASRRHGFLAKSLLDRFGVRPGDAGCILAEVSHLAAELREVIRHVHSPLEAPEGTRVLVSLVSLANELAHLIGLTFFRGTADTELVITELPAWKILSAARPQILQWDLARVVFDLDREYQASETFMRAARVA